MATKKNPLHYNEKFSEKIFCLLLENFILHGRNFMTFAQIECQMNITSQTHNYHRRDKYKMRRLRELGIEEHPYPHNKRAKMYVLNLDMVKDQIDEIKNKHNC